MALLPDCTDWKALSYSAKEDSEVTRKEIISQNAARAKVCPK